MLVAGTVSVLLEASGSFDELCLVDALVSGSSKVGKAVASASVLLSVGAGVASFVGACSCFFGEIASAVVASTLLNTLDAVFVSAAKQDEFIPVAIKIPLDKYKTFLKFLITIPPSDIFIFNLPTENSKKRMLILR